MRALGIECNWFKGNSFKWNKIKIDGEWYNVDCGLRDKTTCYPGFITHKWFLKSDQYYANTPTIDAGRHNLKKSTDNETMTATDTKYDNSTVLNECYSQLKYNQSDNQWYLLYGADFVKCDTSKLLLVNQESLGE